jgi:hypothetical protein
LKENFIKKKAFICFSNHRIKYQRDPRWCLLKDLKFDSLRAIKHDIDSTIEMLDAKQVEKFYLDQMEVVMVVGYSLYCLLTFDYTHLGRKKKNEKR